MEKTINGVVCRVVDSEWDIYFDMALKMLEEIMSNNEKGKKTVMIVPVGPTDQYPILARLVNQLKVSLKNVWFFNKCLSDLTFVIIGYKSSLKYKFIMTYVVIQL